MLGSLFHAILYQPIFNVLIALYNLIPDFGVALIVLTILLRLALFPLSQKSIKSQKELSEIQPEIKKLQRQYKDDKQKQAQALMELYKEKKVNPMSGCLPLLVQLPILIALYQVCLNVFKPDAFSALYSFVSNPGQVNPMFFGFIDLSLRNIPLAVLAGLAQFWQTKMILPKTDNNKSKTTKTGGMAEQMSGMMNKQMLYFMPVLTVIIGFSLPGGLPLYWLVTTLLTVGQQYLPWGKKDKKKISNGVKNN